jgi:quinolinate synthase
MKMNNLEKIKNALETLQPRVEVEAALRDRALVPLDRMMRITRGESVPWPGRFEAPAGT